MKTAKTDIAKMIAIIKANYQYTFKDATKENIQLMVDTWHDCLKDYDSKIIAEAFKRALSVCKMPPTVADVLESVDKLYEAAGRTPENLWAAFENTVEKLANAYINMNLGYEDGSEEEVIMAWNVLPGALKEFCVTYKGFLGFLEEGLNKYDKSRFLKDYPDIKSRLIIRKRMPNVRELFTSKLTLKGVEGGEAE